MARSMSFHPENLIEGKRYRFNYAEGSVLLEDHGYFVELVVDDVSGALFVRCFSRTRKGTHYWDLRASSIVAAELAPR